MSNYLDNRRDIAQSQVQQVVQRALSLSKQINATVEDVGQENIDKQTVMMIREFKAGMIIHCLLYFLVFFLELNKLNIIVNYSHL